MAMGMDRLKKIQGREAKASLLVLGRGKFRPPKPGGRCMTLEHFPLFRRATPAPWKFFLRQKVLSSAPVD